MATEKELKLKAMKSALQHIKKATKKDIAYQLKDRGIDPIQRIGTGSFLLDNVLGGGIPRGRICELYGAESSGKTLIASKTIAEAQKNDGVCAIIDTEHAFDPVFASKLGVNSEELFISQPDTMEEAFIVLENFIDAGCDLVVLDSTAALVPKEEFENEGIKPTMALVARGMSQELKKITPKCANNNTAVIFINQTRDNIGVMYGDPTATPGGKALKFYSSIRIQVSRNKNLDVLDDNKDIIKRGIKCKIVKNKTAIPYKTAEFSVWLNGNEATKDPSEEIITLGIEKGIIKRVGKDKTESSMGRYYYIEVNGNEYIFMGRDNAIEEFTKIPEVINYVRDNLFNVAITTPTEEEIKLDKDFLDDVTEKDILDDEEKIINIEEFDEE